MAMTLRLSSDDDRLLSELAEADGVSKHEAAVRAIRETAARRGRVDDDQARRQRLLRLMEEIEAETTDEQRAESRQAAEALYDDRGLPA